MAENSRTKKKRRSLEQFERDQRRAACAVCSLPAEIQEELRRARAKKISQTMTLEWLRQEAGITLTRQDFTAHSAAHHDQWDEQ